MFMSCRISAVPVSELSAHPLHVNPLFTTVQNTETLLDRNLPRSITYVVTYIDVSMPLFYAFKECTLPIQTVNEIKISKYYTKLGQEIIMTIAMYVYSALLFMYKGYRYFLSENISMYKRNNITVRNIDMCRIVLGNR